MTHATSHGSLFRDCCAHAGNPPPFSRWDCAKWELLAVHWGVRAGDRVLDFGCGAGRLGHRLEEMVGSRGVVSLCRPAADDRGAPAHPTRGRCGSPRLHRTTLPFAPPRRF